MQIVSLFGMPDQKEQIKQKIIIELEHVRLLNSFLVPMILFLITLLFTNQYFSNAIVLKILIALGNLAGIFILFLIRSSHIYKARKYIETL